MSGDTPRTDERRVILGPHLVRACAGCRDGADDFHAYTPLTDKEWLDRLGALESELAEARAQLEQTKKERDEFKDFWENATDLAAEARAEVERLRRLGDNGGQEIMRLEDELARTEAEVERLRAIEEAAKVIDALAQQRSCSLYEVAHESWPGQFGQLHRALTTQEDR